MDMKLKEDFLARWGKYFGPAELPITFCYTDRQPQSAAIPPPPGRRCMIADMARIRHGESVYFDVNAIGCPGGRRYAGFRSELMPGFEHFLSCGIPGKMHGERYKKTPELVRQFLAHSPDFEAPAPYIVFKRWDKLEPADDPQVVIFFAPPDVLAGLFTLVNFDEAEANGVVAPFGAGCATIVEYPYLEKDAARPRAVLGMFDISARMTVPADALTLAVPINKFQRMVANMDESFLTTGTWGSVQKRIAGAGHTGRDRRDKTG
jgi:uncharacterized protein (DUF169 family)